MEAKEIQVGGCTIVLSGSKYDMLRAIMDAGESFVQAALMEAELAEDYYPHVDIKSVHAE